MRTASAPQHLVLASDLLHASLALSMLEVRVVVALQLRMRRHRELSEIRIPLGEIIGGSGRKLSKKDYEAIALLCVRLESQLLLLRPAAAESGGCQRRRLFTYVRYERGKPFLRVQLHEDMLPYLRPAKAALITAPYAQVCKLRTSATVRIYWLLRECAAQGLQTLQLGVEQLRWELDLGQKYPHAANLAFRFLKPAQTELARTDLPFEFEPLKKGTAIYAFCLRLLTGWSAGPPPVDSEQAQVPLLSSVFGFWLRFLVGGAYALTLTTTTTGAG